MGNADERIETDYVALLLRCWRDEGGWRFSVERIGGHSGAAGRAGFADLGHLIAYLTDHFRPGAEDGLQRTEHR